MGHRCAARSCDQWIKFTPSKFEYTSATQHLDYADIPLTVPLSPTGTFDLADTIGGGTGRLPGLGGPGDLAAAPGTYTLFPNNLFVDGTFVPNKTPGAIVIDGAGHTYDFEAQTSGDYYSPWRNGSTLDTNPVDIAVLPNYLGDPANHSLISGHANNGISADHGFIGDPFLTLIPYVAPGPPTGTLILIQ